VGHEECDGSDGEAALHPSEDIVAVAEGVKAEALGGVD
jgi:hypothetical protein